MTHVLIANVYKLRRYRLCSDSWSKDTVLQIMFRYKSGSQYSTLWWVIDRLRTCTHLRRCAHFVSAGVLAGYGHCGLSFKGVDAKRSGHSLTAVSRVTLPTRACRN